MTSEEVCEIGKWKTSNAFRSHYLRLGASKTVSGRVSNFVHTVSPGCSVDPDQSRTPARPPEPRGSDWEGEAQSIGATRFDLSTAVKGEKVVRGRLLIAC